MKNVVLETMHGKIEIALFDDVAPKACENFRGLAQKGYFNGNIFHRVIRNFMIQSGDPTGTGFCNESLWGKPFEVEVSSDVLFDRPGLLGMANLGPDTNGSQFFITTVPTPHLNGKYTVFGEVVRGYEAVQAVEIVPVDHSNNDRPLQEQKIIKARVKKK